MPLIFNHTRGADIIAVWQMTENEVHLFESMLLASEKLEARSVRNTLIKRQKLGVRYLIDEMMKRPVEIAYDENGKPNMLGSDLELSMTHSEDRVAVMISPKIAGLDLQVLHPKIEWIIQKFMSDEEINALSKEHRMEHAHVYWCAKEALYKVYSKKKLIFKEQLLIASFNYNPKGGIIAGEIVLADSSQKYQLKYEKLDNYILVYVLND